MIQFSSMSSIICILESQFRIIHVLYTMGLPTSTTICYTQSPLIIEVF